VTARIDPHIIVNIQQRLAPNEQQRIGCSRSDHVHSAKSISGQAVEIFRKIVAANNQIQRVTLGERARNNKVEIGLLQLEEKEL
jgi:hypothetical protein